MKKKNFSREMILAFITLLLLSACGPQMVTKAAKFPLMYEENPQSILVLPPMNRSTASDAKEYYSTTIQEPLSFTGFYTFPYEVTADILKQEGIYDSELLLHTPLVKFREVFRRRCGALHDHRGLGHAIPGHFRGLEGRHRL